MKQKYIDFYMSIAYSAAKMSHAERAKVGAVVVKDDVVIYGYNGMPSGWENECEEYISPYLPKYTFNQQCLPAVQRTKLEVLHAESNAISKCAKNGYKTQGATLFCTHLPCLECAKLIHQAGISVVIYDIEYESKNNGSGKDFLVQCGIDVVKYEEEL